MEDDRFVKCPLVDEMIEDIADITLIMEGGYKVLNHNDIIEILKRSMK